MIDDDIRAPADRLIRQARLGSAIRFERLSGGANNRVFRVETESGRLVVLKAYFHHVDDTRDRLRAEYAFSEMAWRCGERALPEPLAQDRERRLGLYAYVPGRAPTREEVDGRAIDAALTFIRGIDRHREEGGELPDASEACFRLIDHLATVERRLARLRAMPLATPLHVAAARFVAGQVEPAWKMVREGTLRTAEQVGIVSDAVLEKGARVISPSDFGFHNALIDKTGAFRFLDFEYAGWDDPAKLLGDFFNQVAVPVPLDHHPRFRDALAARAANPEREAIRLDLALPIHTVKWVAIILNDFLRAGDDRRRFAGAEGAAAERLERQLIKAQGHLTKLKKPGF